MVRYLLGDLTEEEQTQIEERFLSDNEYFERLAAVEDALIDDYAQGMLNEDERRKIEGLLLSSARQAREADFVRDLIGYVSARPSLAQNEQNSVRINRPGKLRWLWEFLRAGNRGMRLSIAAVSFLIAVGLLLVIWNLALQRGIARIEAQRATLEEKQEQLRQQIAQQEEARARLEREVEDARRERAVLKQQMAALRESVPPFSNPGLALLELGSSAISRGGSELKVARIHPGISQFRISINLDKADEYESYATVIKSFEGREVWSRDQIKSSESNPGKLVFTVPARVFAKDDYTLTLSGQTKAGSVEEIADYSFRVKR